MADFTALKTAIQTYIKQNGNEEITGEILQEILLSVVTTLGDSAINNLVTALANEVAARQNADVTLQQNITNEATTRGNADTALQGLINGVKNNVDNGYVYAGIATPSSTPTTGKVFYLALTAGTYTNFGNTVVTQGINILKYNGSAWVLDSFIGIDDTPTQDSPKLVKSGGVFGSSLTNSAAFDLSTYNDGATYTNISSALAALNNIPSLYKKGGMSIKFIMTSDNSYVHYTLRKKDFSLQETDWECEELKKDNIIISTSGYGVAAKVASTFPYFKPLNGIRFRLILTKGNGVDNATLNINSTGAYPLYFNGKQASSTNQMPKDEYFDCYFDGTHYQAVSVATSNDPSGVGSIPLSIDGGKTLYDENKRQTENYGPNGLVKLTFANGGYIKTNVAQVSTSEGVPVVVPNVNFAYCVASCVAGDSFIINGTGGGSSRAWAFTDSEWNVLKVSAGDITCNGVVLVAPPNSAYIILNDETRQGFSYKGTSLYSTLVKDIYRNKKDYNYDLSTKTFNFQQRCLSHDNFYREVTRADKWKIGENYGTILTYFSPRSDYASVDDGFRINTEYINHSEDGGVPPYDNTYPHQVISGYLTNNQSVTIAKAFRLIRVPGVSVDGVVVGVDYDKKFRNKIIETSVPSLGRYAEVVFNFVDEENYESFEILYNTFTEGGADVDKVVINYKRTILGFTQTTEVYSQTRPSTTFDIVYVDGNMRLYLDYVNIYTYMDDEPKALIDTLYMDVAKYIGVSVSTANVYEYRILNLFGIDSKDTFCADEAYLNNGVPMKYNMTKTYDYQYQYGKILRICGKGDTLPDVVDYQPNAKFVNTSDNKIYKNNGSAWEDTTETISSYMMFYDTYNKKLYTNDNGSLVLQSDNQQCVIPANVQRFEVRANDTMTSAQARCELTHDGPQRMWKLNLKKRRIVFNVLLPVSYLSDDATAGEGETFLQFQASTDGGKTRQPIFTIAASVIGEGADAKVRYHLNRRYIPTRPVPPAAQWNEIRYGEDDVDLGEVALGSWDTFEVYYKEGYMTEHFPELIVKRNGEEVYHSVLPNTYNVMCGSYVRYGVYKSVYRHNTDEERLADNRKRIVYISNYKEEV